MKKIIVREVLFIFPIAMLGFVFNFLAVPILNFLDKTRWTYKWTIGSALLWAAIFIVGGYVIRLIILAVRTLRAK